MAMPTRIALTLPMGPKLEDSITLVEWAEANGFDDVWFSDAMAPDSLTMAAAVAPHTQRMRVGVAVTPVYTRTPAVFAAPRTSLHNYCRGASCSDWARRAKPSWGASTGSRWTSRSPA